MVDAVVIGLGCCLLGGLMLSHDYRILGWIPLVLGSSVVASAVLLSYMGRRR